MTAKKSELERKLAETSSRFPSFDKFTKDNIKDAYDGNGLEEDVVYHLNRMAGFPLLILKENRRTIRRADKMLEGCKKDGMTTPAIVVDAALFEGSGMTLIDPISLKPATEDQIVKSYALIEGHGRLHGWILGFALDGQLPFDYNLIYKKYNSTEEVMSAYTSTNLFMTRTTNADRLNIASVRCNDPCVKACTRRIKDEGCIAKAAQYWTYGKEMKPDEVRRYIEKSPDAPKIDPVLVEARGKVYEAFKERFSHEGAVKIYRGVPAAQWTADKLKDPNSAMEVAERIHERIRGMNESDFTAIITAKTDKKKHVIRDVVIKNILDKVTTINNFNHIKQDE